MLAFTSALLSCLTAWQDTAPVYGWLADKCCCLWDTNGHTSAGVHNLSDTPPLHVGMLVMHARDHLAAPQAFARALRRATEHDERRGGQIASSKGVLTQQ